MSVAFSKGQHLHLRMCFDLHLLRRALLLLLVRLLDWVYHYLAQKVWRQVREDTVGVVIQNIVLISGLFWIIVLGEEVMVWIYR